jgi:translation initiation factor 5B
MISPFFFPVDAESFNFVRPLFTAHCSNLATYNMQACVIFGAVTIFGITSWYFTPEEKWLSRQQVLQALHTADKPEATRD